MLKNVLRSQGYTYLHTAIEAFIFVATIPIIFHDTFPRWNLKFHRSSFAIYGLTPFFPRIPSSDQFVIMLCKHFSNKKKKRKWKEELKEKEKEKKCQHLINLSKNDLIIEANAILIKSITFLPILWYNIGIQN